MFSRKMTARLSNAWRSAPAELDGSQLPGRQSHLFQAFSRSNTSLVPGGAEPRSDHRADGSLPTQPSTINVVLFGETGVGKSSVINLIARRSVAEVSSDVNGCTMQSTRYDIPFDGMRFTIFDTIGLEEPQMGVNGYLRAIEKAYELIVRLSAAGGVHLLLFCMRGGRITATTQSNYRLFCECLCNTKVPIALVFTGLEREAEMENWWMRNKTHIEHYGIKSNGHACITAVQDDTPGEDLKFTESQRKIRDLLKDCALKNDAFLLDSHSWFARLGRGMKSFIAKHRSPRKRDVMKVLTQRCKLDHDTAKKIADMMEKDSETQDPPGSGVAAAPPADSHDTAVKTLETGRGGWEDVPARPSISEARGEDEVRRNADNDVDDSGQPYDVPHESEAGPLAADEDDDESEVEHPISGMQVEDEDNVKNTKRNDSQLHSYVKATHEVARKKVTDVSSPPNPQGDSEAGSPIIEKQNVPRVTPPSAGFLARPRRVGVGHVGDQSWHAGMSSQAKPKPIEESWRQVIRPSASSGLKPTSVSYVPQF